MRSNRKNFFQIVLLAVAIILPTICAASQQEVHSLQESYAKVAEKAFPAVVVVLNCQYDWLNRLVEAKSGSGFFVREDGVLVTNYHVIAGAYVVGVRFLDGELRPAAVIGSSKSVDLAVLKVEVDKKVPYLKFADTSTVKVGHYAIAIGAPHSLSHTMTTGVVSFKGRKLGFNNNEDFIQTDASINPGNSGGPLLNIDGLVIGVNDCGIMADGGGSVGLNFAIDANLAQRVLAQILKQGFKKHPYMGVTMENTDPEGKGTVVTIVKKKSPAEAAGLKVGDVLCKLGQYPIKDIFQFETVLHTGFSSGDTTTMEVLRDGKKKKLTIKFGGE